MIGQNYLRFFNPELPSGITHQLLGRPMPHMQKIHPPRTSREISSKQGEEESSRIKLPGSSRAPLQPLIMIEGGEFHVTSSLAAGLCTHCTLRGYRTYFQLSLKSRIHNFEMKSKDVCRKAGEALLDNKKGRIYSLSLSLSLPAANS